MRLKLPANTAHLSLIISMGVWSPIIGMFNSQETPWPKEWDSLISGAFYPIIVLLLVSGSIGLFFSFQASRQQPWTLVSGILGGLANALFLLLMAFLIWLTGWGAV